MDIEEIEVTIEKDGKVRIEVRGVKGGACLDITRTLEEALGGKVEARELTPEALDAPGREIGEEERLRGGVGGLDPPGRPGGTGR